MYTQDSAVSLVSHIQQHMSAATLTGDAVLQTCFATEDNVSEVDEWVEESVEDKSLWGKWFKQQAQKAKAAIAAAKAKAEKIKAAIAAAKATKSAACVASMDLEQTELLESSKWAGWGKTKAAMKAKWDKAKTALKAKALEKLKVKKTVSMDMDATMNGAAMGGVSTPEHASTQAT